MTTQEKTEKENSDGAWVTPSLLRLCTTVEDAGNLILGTFAVTNQPVNQPEQARKDLMSQLDGLTKDFQKLEVDQRKIVAFPRTVLSYLVKNLKGNNNVEGAERNALRSSKET